MKVHLSEDLVRRLYREIGFKYLQTQKDLKAFVEEFLEYILNNAPVRIKNFGKFYYIKSKTKARDKRFKFRAVREL